MKKSIITIAAMLLISAISGCVTRTITKNEPRKSVHFASAQSAQIFYDYYLARYHRNISSDSTNAVCNNVTVSIHLPYWQYRNVSENVRFNRAIEQADTDRDGVISDAEAQNCAALPLHPAHH